MKKMSYPRFLARAAMTLLAVFCFIGARAQQVQIGDGTSTNSYLPSNSLYNYSISQQIYTAEEIAASGNITSIAFYNGGTEKSRKLSIYMAHTTKSAFDSNTDWIALSDENLVYQGTEAVALTAGAWTTFTLDTQFAYNGTDNLVIGVLDLTGSWESGMSCRVFTTPNYQALYKYQDSGAYSIDGEGVEGYWATAKNQIILGGIQQACPAPTGLTVTPHPYSADLSWTENGTATSWEIAYKTTDAEEFTNVTANTNPFTLTGLNSVTAYTAKVRALSMERDNDITTSSWSAPVNFTTQTACPTPTGLASSNVTTTSATLSWTVGYEETNWVLQYGTTNNFAEGTYTEVEVSATPTQDLTGLNEATTYYARVKASCGGDDESVWSSVISFATAETCPDGKVCIGTGTATSNYLPANNYYNYSLTEQIYTAEEIGQAGAILSLDFFKASTTEMVKNLDIYIVSTNKTAFESTSDWITVTASDLVYSGTVTFADNDWTTIELDNPFIYDGNSNICIVVDNNTGGYVSNTPFRVFDASENQALYYQNDNANPDPTGTVNVTGSRSSQKNRIRLGIGEPPACPKPTGLAVNYEGGKEATISWTSDATAWNLSVNGVVTPVTQNPYTLTNLELATTYEVKVQADCGDSQSEWAGPVSFTTDACMPEDQIVVNYTLTDSYGDGWNGNEILVVDENCSIVEELTISSGSSNSGTLRVCGSAVSFYWYKGSYPDETSWTFTDAAGNELFSGAGETSMASNDVLYTIDLNPYAAPSDIEVSEVTSHTAKVSWTEKGTATAWQIKLINGEEESIIDADRNPFTLTGLDPTTNYDVNVRAVGPAGTSLWPCLYAEFTTETAAPIPTGLAATHVTATSATLNWEGSAETYNVSYAPVAHGEVIESIDFEDSSMGEWTTIDADGDGFDWVLGSACGGVYLAEGSSLAGTGHDESSADLVVSGSYSNVVGALTPDNYLVSPQVDLGGSISFWVCGQDATYAAEHFGVAVSTTGNTDAADFTTIWQNTLTAKGGNDRGNTAMFVKGGAKANPGTTRSGNRDQGNWYHYTVDLSDYSGQGYVAIRHFGCTDQFMLDLDDIVIEGPAEVQWINLTGVSGNSVDIDGLEDETEYIWKVQGYYGEQDGTSGWSTSHFTTGSYSDAPTELAATATSSTATLEWTGSQESYNVQYRTAAIRDEYYFNNFNAGYDAVHAEGWNWDGSIIYGLEDPIYNIASADNNFLQMGFGTTAETTATIVSPELPEYESGALVEFYYFGYNAANTFQVGYSSTTNDLEAFTWSDPIEAPLTVYTLFNEVIPDGTKYVAFKATAASSDEAIFIDDFGIFGSTTPAGEWISATVEEPTLPLTGLDPNTEYEWQVQGIYEGDPTEWSEIATFTTLPLIVLANDDSNNEKKNNEIIYDYDGETVDVTLADRKLFKDGSWNTLCLPFDVTDGDDSDELTFSGTPLEGATAKTLTGAEINGTHVTLDFGEAVTTLKAGVPYIIKWAAAEENISEPTFTGVLIQDVAEADRTISPIPEVKFIGYYDAKPITANDANIYYMTADNTLKYTGVNRTLKACRAYFEFSEAATAGGVREFTLNFGDSEATGITSIDNEQLNNESGWYTVDGKKLDKQPKRKGVYINNGIKVVIK